MTYGKIWNVRWKYCLFLYVYLSIDIFSSIFLFFFFRLPRLVRLFCLYNIERKFGFWNVRTAENSTLGSYQRGFFSDRSNVFMIARCLADLPEKRARRGFNVNTRWRFCRPLCSPAHKHTITKRRRRPWRVNYEFTN